MSYRCQPQHDLKLADRKEAGHGPRNPRDEGELSAVLINATLKSPFPPVALPKREFMENARGLWERFGLPKLTPDLPGMDTISAGGPRVNDKREWVRVGSISRLVANQNASAETMSL